MPQTTETHNNYPFAGLVLPESSEQPDNLFHEQAAVQHWVENLPMASPLECAKLLFKALFDMNRCNMVARQRISALELLVLPVTSITLALKQRFSPGAFPMSEKNHKIAMLIRELNREMAIGYKCAIRDHINASQVTEQQQSHIIALHRLMHHLSQSLFISYLIYEAQPAHSWLELHLLFVYSSVNKMDNTAVQSLDESGDHFTIRQLYIKIMLLAAASPYQLRQRETELLFASLDRLLLSARLSVNKGIDQTANGFVIFLHADKPPVNVAQSQHVANSQALFLDTTVLLETLQLSLTENVAEEHRLPELSRHLKQVLLKNWGKGSQRQYVRTQLNFELKIAVGLSEIHELVESSQQPDTATLKAEHEARERESLKRASLFLTPDDLVDPHDSVLSLQNYNEPAKNTGTFLSSQTVKADFQINGDELVGNKQQLESDNLHACQTVNESSGGYCIDWPSESNTRIRVGELIAIQSTSREREFGLAITRWIKCLSSRQVLAGIELLANSSTAVKIRADKVVPKHMTITYYPALMITRRSDNSQQLVTPSDLFKTGEVLLVKDHLSAEKRLRLNQMLESTGLFSQYQVSEVVSVKNADMPL